MAVLIDNRHELASIPLLPYKDMGYDDWIMMDKWLNFLNGDDRITEEYTYIDMKTEMERESD